MAQSIGERLKSARLARKLSLAQASQGTRIRAHYLEAMENDDFDAIPSLVQARGFLRIYAELLELDGAALVDELRGFSPADAPAPAPQPAAENPPPAPAPPAQIPAEPDSAEEPAPTFEPEPVVEEIAENPSSLSQTIFKDIGEQLRARRELLSLTLTEIERHTHVRKHHLEAIERGAMFALPSPVQARGMLTAYARFLDIDAEAILLRFAEGLQARRIESLPPEKSRALRPRSQGKFFPTLARYISVDMLVGLGMVIAMTAFAIWGANRLIQLSQGTDAEQAEGPSISEVLLSPIPNEEATVEATPTAVQIIEADNVTVGEAAPATPIPTIASIANVQVIVSVVDRTFLRVIVDGKETFNGRAEAGSAFPFEADERIEVLTGNGSAIQIIYNQQTYGAMGAFGQVVNLVYTAGGIQTPTPTIAPTVTITPSPTRTPRPSATPRATRTPRATPTFEPGG